MDFFHKLYCDRCRAHLTFRIMSIFNNDTICLICQQKEQKHPAYEKAIQAKREAFLKGDTNFPGIGLPPDLR